MVVGKGGVGREMAATVVALLGVVRTEGPTEAGVEFVEEPLADLEASVAVAATVAGGSVAGAPVAEVKAAGAMEAAARGWVELVTVAVSEVAVKAP